jgi:hypothetical protein
MTYTPEMTMKSSRTLRRIAWALDMPMTKAIEKVCQACRDRSKCSDCQFNFQARIHDEKERR